MRSRLQCDYSMAVLLLAAFFGTALFILAAFEVGLRLRRTLPNSTLRLVEGCGHMPQEEQPAATLGLLESFIGG